MIRPCSWLDANRVRQDFPLAQAIPFRYKGDIPGETPGYIRIMDNQLHSSGNEPTIWAFDLGKGSIGEAVRQGHDFPHTESLLIPEDLARRGPAANSGTPANRYRALKTREAHQAREEWLEIVWKAAALVPLQKREAWRNPETNKWQLKQKADYRLERQFAPKPGEKTKDGAPSDEAWAAICYTSCLLRIRLLRGDSSLCDWQVFKALHSALQRRGYGRVPWAAREALRKGKSAEELEKEEEKKLQLADARYRDAVGKWPDFKRMVAALGDFQFPCYYDAWKMGLWNPSSPTALESQAGHASETTQNIRFDRADVRRELIQLGNQAAAILPALRDSFARWKEDGWKFRHPVSGKEIVCKVLAKTFGEFLCDGPTGQPDESSFETFLSQRAKAGIERGSVAEWMAALGQKTPSFDNRILNDCVLIPRFHVCKADVRLDPKTARPIAESLLASEVTFLLKLKNLLVSEGSGQRKLTAAEIRAIFEFAQRQIQGAKLTNPKGELLTSWPAKVADCFSITRSEWGNKKALGSLQLRPLPGHEEVKAPKTSGRSAYSRVALRVLKELILSEDSPSAFHSRLIKREAELLMKLGSAPDRPLVLCDDSSANEEAKRKQENDANQKRGLLVSELNFLLQMRKSDGQKDSWEDLFVPSQTLDALQQRHTEDGKLDADAAIRDLLGTINDPIVRHRLWLFSERLKKLQHGDKKEGLPRFGVPDAIVLEFARKDFMGEEAAKKYQRFLDERERDRKEARNAAAELGLETRSSGLRYELWKAQGGICLYSGKPLAETDLDKYEIDHIVPRSLNGPDATVNYVLTFHDINHTKEKGKLTPFGMLHGKDGWSAYVERVKARATTLRNKKVQLLTRQDAPELVQRYTALAETAWVSKLAQTIVNLRFGWTNGNDADGRKRVIVVSGGLTARIRRKYHLDELLYADTTDPEVLEAKMKNREDKRHHALDAMVMTFIPQWARNPDKEGFFKLPQDLGKNPKAFFGKFIEKVRPRNIARLRPELETTIYGVRRVGNSNYIVGREDLVSLATKEVKNKTVLKPRDDIKPARIVDGAIRKMVTDFLAQHTDLTLEEWQKWCTNLRLTPNGPRIVKVLMTKSNPDALDEYVNVAKDQDEHSKRGQFKRAATHQGYFIYTVAAPTSKEPGKRLAKVRPVYAFQRVKDVESALRQEGGVEIVDYFWSNCQVRFESPWEFKGTVYPADEYTLKTVWEQGNAVLYHGVHGLIGAKPKHNAPVGVKVLAGAKMRRVR